MSYFTRTLLFFVFFLVTLNAKAGGTMQSQVNTTDLAQVFCEDVDVSWIQAQADQFGLDCITQFTEFYDYSGQKIILVDYQVGTDCPIADLTGYYYYCDGTPVCGWNGSTGELNCEPGFIDSLVKVDLVNDEGENIDEPKVNTTDLAQVFCEDVDVSWIQAQADQFGLDCITQFTEFYDYSGQKIILVDYQVGTDCPIADLTGYYYYCDGTPVCGWNGSTGELNCEPGFIDSLVKVDLVNDEGENINEPKVDTTDLAQVFCEDVDVSWIQAQADQFGLDCITQFTEFYDYSGQKIILVDYQVGTDCPIADLTGYYYYCDGTPVCGWNGSTGELNCEPGFIDSLVKVDLVNDEETIGHTETESTLNCDAIQIVQTEENLTISKIVNNSSTTTSVEVFNEAQQVIFTCKEDCPDDLIILLETGKNTVFITQTSSNGEQCTRIEDLLVGETTNPSSPENTLDCDAIQIVQTEEALTISKIVNNSSTTTSVEVFNEAQQVIFTCKEDCPDDLIILLETGKNTVFITQTNSNGEQCTRIEDLLVGETTNPSSPENTLDCDAIQIVQTEENLTISKIVNNSSTTTSIEVFNEAQQVIFTCKEDCPDDLIILLETGKNTVFITQTNSNGEQCTRVEDLLVGETTAIVACNFDLLLDKKELYVNLEDNTTGYKIEVYNKKGKRYFLCDGDCDNSQFIKLKKGKNYLYVSLIDESGKLVCETYKTIKVNKNKSVLLNNNLAEGRSLKKTVFTAYESSTKVSLTWVNENNHLVSEFIIERTTDGENFESITKIKSLPTNELFTYNVLDENPVQGQNKYRVKSIRKDGQVVYSELQTVEFHTIQDLAVYPNPAASEVTINLEGLIGKTIQMKLINQLGATVYQKELRDLSENKSVINLQDYTNGLYFLNISVDGVNTTSKKLMIVKE